MPPSWFDILAQLGVVVLSLIGVTLPAISLCWVGLREIPPLARVAVGMATGFGLFVILSWSIGYISFNLVVWGLFFEYAVGAVASWFMWFRQRAADSQNARDSSINRRQSITWLLAVLGTGVVIHVYAMSYSQLPPGSDPMFHCTVGLQLQLNNHTIHSLWPLEKLELNYPIGSHIWCAVVSEWTSLPVHTVFRHSFLIAMIGCGFMAMAWADELIPGAGLWACFCYLFMSYQASYYPYTWGGLPSTLAMWLAMASLYTAVCLRGSVSWIVTALLSGSVAMIHHHTMLALWGGVGLVGIIFLFRRETRPMALRCVVAHALGLIVSSPQTYRLVSQLLETSKTGVVEFLEPYSSPWSQLLSWGPMILIFGFLGCCMKQSRVRSAGKFLMSLGLVWLISFVCLDYGARWITRHFWGTESTPFTPSRFLFDFQHLLAIFAGCCVFTVLEKCNQHVRHCLGASIALISIIILCGDMTSSLPWQPEDALPRWRTMAEDRLLEPGAWVRDNSVSNAIVLGPASGWMTYVCQREATNLFIPISEPIDRERRQLKDDLIHDPFSRTWQQWSDLLDKPLYAILLSGRPLPDQQPIRNFGPITIYKLSER